MIRVGAAKVEPPTPAPITEAWLPLAPVLTRPRTYLPTPEGAPLVQVVDHRAGKWWTGVLHDGFVHDPSGFIDPFDINWRYTIRRDGVDISDELMLDD